MIELTKDTKKIKLVYEDNNETIMLMPVPIRKHSIIQEYQSNLLEIFCDNQFHIGASLANQECIKLIENTFSLLPKEPQDTINIDRLTIYDIQQMFFSTSSAYAEDGVRSGCQLKLEEDHYLLPSLLSKIHKLDFFSIALKASTTSTKKREKAQI
jgi:hypothetical protein